MFHDLEARGRNWDKELLSVLWALRTNVIRDTTFNFVYGGICGIATRNIS
jgi:hypothetical protein